MTRRSRAGWRARILTEGFEHEIDFAYSDEFIVDHAFTVPLNFMRPQADLPVVPIFLNFMAPPIRAARRYLKIGRIVRTIIEEWEEPMRVAVITTTGHMTNGVGGPYMMRHAQMPESEMGSHDQRLHAAQRRSTASSPIPRGRRCTRRATTPPASWASSSPMASRAARPYSWYDYVPSNTQPLQSLLEWTEDQLNADQRQEALA